MDNFDQKLKNLAQEEPLAAPRGFNERIENILDNLPGKKKSKKISAKILLIASAFLLVSAVSVMASPAVQRVAAGLISYFQTAVDSRYASQKIALEKYNNVIGAAVEDQGITLRIDNIALDDAYLNVFYTVEDTSPITLKGNDEYPLALRLSWTAPHLWFKANGSELDLPAQIESEAYLENDRILKGMQRYSLSEPLPDDFELEISASDIFDVQGNWLVRSVIAKNAVQSASLIVNPDIQATITDGWNSQVTHEIKIDRVVISPFGSKITLTEKVRDCNLFSEFALKDDQGRFLTLIPSQLWAGNENKTVEVTNSFEFLNGNTQMKFLNLIPLSFPENNSSPPQIITASIGAAPVKLRQSEIGNLVIDAIESSAKEIKITSHSEGALPPTQLLLLDENGREVKGFFTNNAYDRLTGRQITTFTFSGAFLEQIARIRTIGIPSYEFTLNTDEQILIPLR